MGLVQCLLDDVMANWTLRLDRILHNLSAFLSFVALDAHLSSWTAVVGQLEAFFRRYHSQVGADQVDDLDGLLSWWPSRWARPRTGTGAAADARSAPSSRA